MEVLQGYVKEKEVELSKSVTKLEAPLLPFCLFCGWSSGVEEDTTLKHLASRPPDTVLADVQVRQE